MNIINFIYKYRSYQLDFDLFKKNKGYFILDGALAYADSFEDLMNEKIEVGCNLATAFLAKKSIRTHCKMQIEFVDDKPVSCYFIKNNPNKDELKQRRGELRKFCNDLAKLTYKVEPFIKTDDVDEQNCYFCKIIDLKQKELHSKEYEEYLCSR